jgi:hypothetical protein
MDYSLKNKTRRTKIKFQIEEITNFFFLTTCKNFNKIPDWWPCFQFVRRNGAQTIWLTGLLSSTHFLRQVHVEIFKDIHNMTVCLLKNNFLKKINFEKVNFKKMNYFLMFDSVMKNKLENIFQCLVMLWKMSWKITY